MKKKYFPYLFCMFFLLFSSVLQAQKVIEKGYIITNAGDTIRGYLSNQETALLYKQVSFQATLNATPILYKPADLKGFYMQGQQYFERFTIYEPYESRCELRFLQRKVGGFVSFYTYEDRCFVKRLGEPLQALYIVKKYKEHEIAKVSDTIYSETGFVKSNLQYSSYYKILYYLKTLNKVFVEWEAHEKENYMLNSKTVQHYVEKFNQQYYPTVELNNEKEEQNNTSRTSVGVFVGYGNIMLDKATNQTSHFQTELLFGYENSMNAKNWIIEGGIGLHNYQTFFDYNAQRLPLSAFNIQALQIRAQVTKRFLLTDHFSAHFNLGAMWARAAVLSYLSYSYPNGTTAPPVITTTSNLFFAPQRFFRPTIGFGMSYSIQQNHVIRFDVLHNQLLKRGNIVPKLGYFYRF